MPGGERSGIIGRVGSGKTTVGRLLTGFYEPLDGRISVDDVDIRQYDPADLRAGVGFVLQDTDLFFGKIRDNIAFGKPNATDEEILAAARLAGVESFIAGHPLGYDMPIDRRVGWTYPPALPKSHKGTMWEGSLPINNWIDLSIPRKVYKVIASPPWGTSCPTLAPHCVRCSAGERSGVVDRGGARL